LALKEQNFRDNPNFLKMENKMNSLEGCPEMS
jgi:hypothetical protein